MNVDEKAVSDVVRKLAARIAELEAKVLAEQETTAYDDQMRTYLGSKCYWETEIERLKTDHEAAIKKAVEDEREENAKVADELANKTTDNINRKRYLEIGRAIRSRGEKP